MTAANQTGKMRAPLPPEPAAMPELAAIRFEPHLLEEQGLPDLPYPVRAAALEARSGT